MSDRDLDQEYVSDEGGVLTLRQIGYFVRYEDPDVERAEDGYIVDETSQDILSMSRSQSRLTLAHPARPGVFLTHIPVYDDIHR